VFVCAVEGTGAVVEKGDHVAVKYTGWLAGAAGVGTKGALFDTNDKPDGKLLKIKACFNV
jgi:FKBP-type peptidyl-prolyl cis-trans isomerase